MRTLVYPRLFKVRSQLAASYCADDGRAAIEPVLIHPKEVFTRYGQTNLVRTTKTKNGVMQIRVQRFYHPCSLVGDYVVVPGYLRWL